MRANGERIVVRGASLALALVLAGGVAAAADREADPDVEIARRHFTRGSEFYAAMQYARALEEFAAARRIQPSPAYDFNIGRCYDRMERFKEAKEAYERYLAAYPPPPDADDVRARVRVLEARLAAADRAPANRPAAT